MMARPGNNLLLLLGLLSLLAGNSRAASADVLLITAASNPINEIETREVRSLYKGRLTSIKGKPVMPLNATPGSVDRNQFLSKLMESNELDYTGYWHVRRYSGQGTPPTEIGNRDELFELLKTQTSGIGYFWAPEGSTPQLPDGLKVIKVK